MDSNYRRLVDSPGSMVRFTYGFHADVSPDGSSIVYSTCEYRDGRLVETWPRAPRQEPLAAYEIGTVSVEGDGKRRLTKADGFVNYPSWSPDGEQIAFIARIESRPSRSVDSYQYPDYNFVFQNDVKIALIATNGSEPQEGELRRIGSTRRVALYPPVWSPEGQRLAYLAYEGKEEYPYDIVLHVVGLDGSNVTRIGQATGPPSWSPDGEELAFASLDGEAPIIYAVKPDGADLRTIWRSESDDSATSISQVSWSPDGSQFLFISDGAYVVRPDGSDLRLLSRAGARGAWSPDGPIEDCHLRTRGDRSLYHVPRRDGSDRPARE